MSFFADLKASSRLAVTVAASAAIVGVIYGYDTSNIAGALLFITEDFDLTVSAQETVTTTVVVGEIVGALAGGALSNAIGRKQTMVAVAATFAVFSVFSALAWTLPVLLVARFLLGLTIGVSVVVVPVFIAESSPAKVRGAMGVLYQVATITGIIVGYLVAWALAGTGSWRWMLGLAAVPAVLVVIPLLRLPDTARWYMMRGRGDEARRVLEAMEPAQDVERDLADMKAALSTREAKGLSGLAEMVRRPHLRATVFVVGLGFFVQITGINAIVYYSPRIFQHMGFTGNAALLGLPALVQVAGLAAVLLSMGLVDRLGRRPVLLTGIGVMIVSNALLVGIFAVSADFGGALTVLGFIGLLLFTAGYSFGFGALVWVYAGESFPARLRSLGSSAMLTSDLVANLIVAAVFLSLLTRLGGAATFVVFGVLAIAAFIFVFKFAPETKGRPLEDIRTFWENKGHWPEELGETRRG